MQRGKCWERASIEEALMGAPGREVSASEMCASGVAKFLER